MHWGEHGDKLRQTGTYLFCKFLLGVLDPPPLHLPVYINRFMFLLTLTQRLLGGLGREDTDAAS